jgi:hypothetical protein
MSITADPLFVAAEASWRRERLSTAYQAHDSRGPLGDDVLVTRPEHPIRRMIVSRLPHPHGHAASEPELGHGSEPESEVATRAA